MFDDADIPPMFDPAKDTAAIFIDFENMRLTVEETDGEPFQINKVLDYIDQNIAQVTIKKAYSNWHFVNPYLYNLLGNNIDLVQIYTSGAQRKNAADIRLAADAMEAVFVFPHVTTYVIVASDSDYTGLILNLRKHGKKVVGIGTRQHTSEHLVRACNLFRYYRTIAADDPHALRAQVAEMDIQEARDLLVRAMQRHRFANRPAVGRWLRWQMIQLAPSFDEADLGFANFREFLEACADVVRVTFDERYQELKIELKEQFALPAAAAAPADQPDAAAAEGAAPAGEPPAGERSIITITPSREREPSRAVETPRPHQDLHFVEPQTFPTRPEDIRRSDYLRTLWEPRIYIYNREVAAPLITEIFRVNGPGKPLSQYDLEEHLLGGFADATLANPLFQRFELTQKTVYAVQKLLFWAGAIRFLENDEHVYWKRRKREIRPEFKDAPQLLEAIDTALARQFAKHMPLLPEVLATLFQGGDTLEYARKIIARAKEPALPTEAPPPPEE